MMIENAKVVFFLFGGSIFFRVEGRGKREKGKGKREKGKGNREKGIGNRVGCRDVILWRP